MIKCNNIMTVITYSYHFIRSTNLIRLEELKIKGKRKK